MKNIPPIVNSAKKFIFLVVILDLEGDAHRFEVRADSKEEAEQIARKTGLVVESVEQI